jgi:hypothetical protein
VKVWWKFKYCNTWLPGAIHVQKNATRCGKLKKTGFAVRRRESRMTKTANMSYTLRTPHGKLFKYARPQPLAQIKFSRKNTALNKNMKI